MNTPIPGARDALGLLLSFALLMAMSGLLIYVDGPPRYDSLLTYFGLLGLGAVVNRLTRLLLGRIWPESEKVEGSNPPDLA